MTCWPTQMKPEANFAAAVTSWLLGLAASMTKTGVEYSTLRSKEFTDRWALDCLKTRPPDGAIVHDHSHVRDPTPLPDSPEHQLSAAVSKQLLRVIDQLNSLVNSPDQPAGGRPGLVPSSRVSKIGASKYYKTRGGRGKPLVAQLWAAGHG